MFCVLLLFQHEIIVDSKLLGDLVQPPGAGRLTPFPVDSRELWETWDPCIHFTLQQLLNV